LFCELLLPGIKQHRGKKHGTIAALTTINSVMSGIFDWGYSNKPEREWNGTLGGRDYHAL